MTNLPDELEDLKRVYWDLGREIHRLEKDKLSNIRIGQCGGCKKQKTLNSFGYCEKCAE